MSSCFNGDWHGRQLGIVAALLAVLACGSASAQSVSDNLPFENSASGRVYNGTTPLRLWHQTRGYGMEASQTAFGGRLAVDLADAIGFMDGQFRVSNESQFGLDIGGGFRWMGPSLLTGDTRVFGLTGWYDGQETNLNNYFNQIGVSFESLGEQIDFRLNANIPLENEKSGDIVIDTGEVTYFQNFLSIGTLIPTDVALRVVDFEVAPRIFDLNAWVYAGGYQMDGEGVSDLGAKGGVRGYVTNDLAVDVGVQDDDTFGTNTVFQIIWTPGRTGAGPTSWVHTLADRMREQVYRNTYVATTQVERTGSSNLTDVDGDDIRVVHVDFTSSAPGDGTFENPYTSLDSVNNGGSEQGDIILVHAQPKTNPPSPPGPSNNIYADQLVVLKDEQRLLGEGGNVSHTVVTQQLGTVTLPETFDGALEGTRPTLQNTSGAAVTLAGITDESENFAGMEVSNFVITGGANAVVSGSNGVATVNINNLAISNTTGDAIALAAMTQTLENNTTRSRFNVTIDEIEFDNVGEDDIQLTSTTSETTLSQSTTISNIDSENGNGIGVNLIQPQRATTINNYNWDGGTTGDGAIRIFEAGTQGGVVLSNSGTGDNLITGGAAGIAYGIKLENSDGAHTVTGTRIIDTGGTSVDVVGGDASMTFTGFIEQSNAQTVLSVTGDHNGTLTFNELTANAGVIEATNGNGLQFNGANGAYVFNDKVTLTGTTPVINVIDADDAATFSFLDVDINYSGTGAAVTVANSDLQTFSISGDIDVTGAGGGTGRPVSITNNTGGSITFNTTIDSSQNGILVSDNENTTVLFAGKVTLDTTTNTAVSLQNNDNGGVSFNDIDITTTSGSGFVALNTDNVVVTGNNNTIAVSAGGASAVGLSLTDVQVGGAGVAFESVSTTGGTNGIVLDGVTGGAVVIGDANNTAGDGGTIENTTGVGVLIVDAANVTLNGLEIENTGGNGIDISQTTTTASNVTINDTNVTDATGVGVDITNVANVSMNTMAISGGTGDGINVDHTNTVQSVVRATDVAISNVGGIGIDFNRSASALSRLTLTNVDVDGATDEGITMDIAGSSTVDITIRQGSSVTNAGDNSAVVLNTTGGSKTVNVLIDGGEFSNNSLAATVAIDSDAGTLNTTVTSNTIQNSNGASGQSYTQRVDGGATLLSFNGNTPTNASANNEVELTQAGGTFEVVDLNTIEARNNNAVVDEVGTVTNDPGGTVPQPTP